jgi:hypothetical protein
MKTFRIKDLFSSLTFLFVTIVILNFSGCGSSGSDSMPDSSPPQVSISFPGESCLTTSKIINISGTASDESNIQSIFVEGSRALSSNNYASWELLYTRLINGTNNLIVDTEDQLGNFGYNIASIEVIVVDDVLNANFGLGPAFYEPVSLAVENSGTLIVANDFNKEIIRVDPKTGNRSLISDVNNGSGPLFISPEHVVVEESGNILVVDDTFPDTVFRIDSISGDRIIISDDNTGSGDNFFTVIDIDLETGDNLFLLDLNLISNLGSVFRLNTTTGERTIISNENIGSGPMLVDPKGITVDSFGRIFVACEDFDSTAIIYEVDILTGDRFIISDSSFTGPDILSPRKITTESNDNLILITSTGVFRVDPLTGIKSLISGSGIYDAGPGPDFGSLTDIEVESTGTLVATDRRNFGNADETIWRINPKEGDRVIISKN